MKNPNRTKKNFKLLVPIVYEIEGGKTKEIHEFDIHKPLAGNIKKVGVIEGLDYDQVINLVADCSEMTVEMLDLMEYEDLNRMSNVVADFLSHGQNVSAQT